MIVPNPRLLRQQRILAEIRATGATSPADALPRSALPAIPDSQFERLVQQGVLREAAPGRFYLFERRRPRPGRLVRVAILWLILILVPILVINLLP